MEDKKGFNPNLSDQEVIKILSMENDLMLFDPDTGEEKRYQSLNSADKKCYCAHIMAIKAIKENQELKKRVAELEKQDKNRMCIPKYLDKLQGKEG